MKKGRKLPDPLFVAFLNYLVPGERREITAPPSLRRQLQHSKGKVKKYLEKVAWDRTEGEQPDTPSSDEIIRVREALAWVCAHVSCLRETRDDMKEECERVRQICYPDLDMYVTERIQSLSHGVIPSIGSPTPIKWGTGLCDPEFGGLFLDAHEFFAEQQDKRVRRCRYRTGDNAAPLESNMEYPDPYSALPPDDARRFRPDLDHLRRWPKLPPEPGRCSIWFVTRKDDHLYCSVEHRKAATNAANCREFRLRKKGQDGK